MAYTAFSVAQGEIPSATKWNTLGSNDAHFYDFLGDNLVWQSWTPTWSGITAGNSTITAYYTQIGKTVICRLHFARGSTGVMTSTPIFTLPVEAHATYGTYSALLGGVYLEDLDTTGWFGSVRSVSTTTGAVYPTETVTSNYILNGGISTTVPFTWGTGDFFSTNFVYEAA